MCFEFRREEHVVDFYCRGDFLNIELVVNRINELIKDAGYQYYRLQETTSVSLFSLGMKLRS